MPKLVFENDSFIIDREKQPLLMAELHYFRVPREQPVPYAGK